MLDLAYFLSIFVLAILIMQIRISNIKIKFSLDLIAIIMEFLLIIVNSYLGKDYLTNIILFGILAFKGLQEICIIYKDK